MKDLTAYGNIEAGGKKNPPLRPRLTLGPLNFMEKKETLSGSTMRAIFVPQGSAKRYIWTFIYEKE